MTEPNRPSGDATERLPSSDGEATNERPSVQYIARMPTAPAPSDDTTPLPAPTRAHAPEPDRHGPYVRPGERQSRPPAGRGGWLAPVLVMLVSVAALAAVLALTRGGTQEQARQPQPSAPTPPAASDPSGTTPSLPSTSDVAPTSGPPSPTSSAPSSTATPGAPTTAVPSPSSVPTTSSSAAPAALPAGVKECATGVGAGTKTSCGFATNVAAAVRAASADSGSFQVQAFSPTTNQGYTLRCMAAPVTVCTGGRSAVVYVAR